MVRRARLAGTGQGGTAMGQDNRDRPWDERLASPDENSLTSLLEGFYKAFGISDYLDQIGILDDRIDRIVKELKELHENIHELDNSEIREDLDNIINLIDDNNSPD
jgi:hypothetical protein